MDHERWIIEADEITKILEEIAIFGGLTTQQLNLIKPHLEKVVYKAGEEIFHEGTPPSHIYIVESGSVRIVSGYPDHPCDLVEFKVGACFGEMSVIGIQPHSATALALSETELIVLSRNTLMNLYKDCPEVFGVLVLNIAREACRRLFETDKTLQLYAQLL